VSVALDSDAIAALEFGDTFRSVAKRMGCDHALVWRLWQQHLGADVPIRRVGWRCLSEDARDLAASMVDGGYTQREIAKILGVSQATIHRVMHPGQRGAKRVTSTAEAEPMWTKARSLMATRLLRAGYRVEAIARQLTNDLPGAPIDAREVSDRFRSSNWPQLSRAA
jgi:transposase-like protein